MAQPVVVDVLPDANRDTELDLLNIFITGNCKRAYYYTMIVSSDGNRVFINNTKTCTVITHKLSIASGYRRINFELYT